MPLSDFNLPNRIIADMMAEEYAEKCREEYKKNPPPPPPPIAPTRVEKGRGGSARMHIFGIAFHFRVTVGADGEAP